MQEKIQQIKMLLMDVDGVLTDGRIILGSHETEMKFFHVQDGMGITLARMSGLKVGIITGRISEAVSRRAEELKFDEVWQGGFSKIEPFETIQDKYNLKEKEIAYVGDDLPDVPLLNRCGFGVAVQNACPEAKAASDYITNLSGGKGAIRETVELILKTQGKWNDVVTNLNNKTGK